jgi:hypothetical protein
MWSAAAVVTDNSSIAVDSLSVDVPLFVAVENSSAGGVMSCADLVEMGDAVGLADVIRARMTHDLLAPARRAVIREYFLDSDPEASQRRFESALEVHL